MIELHTRDRYMNVQLCNHMLMYHIHPPARIYKDLDEMIKALATPTATLMDQRVVAANHGK